MNQNIVQWAQRLSGTLALSPLLFAQATLGQSGLAAQLQDLEQILTQAQHHSTAAESAASIEELKQHADEVFAAIWGQSSGLAHGTTGAAVMHGWKTRWQTTGEEFDEYHVARHGSAPPNIADLTQLGFVGRARQVRGELVALQEADPSQVHLEHVIHSLNNVIGWMRLDNGITKAENQPRVDLTYMWDAPSMFWNTSADTGWIFEAFSQALNILKTDYSGNLALAQSHAAAMTAILDRCHHGVDANDDGAVAPMLMEGGLMTALTHAGYAGLTQ